MEELKGSICVQLVRNLNVDGAGTGGAASTYDEPDRLSVVDYIIR